MEPQHASTCGPIESVFGVLGKAWAGAVVDALLNGNQRFSEIARAVPGVSDSVLTSRLKELCEHGLARRVVDAGPPVSVRYELTEAGDATRDILEAVRRYADRYPISVRPPE